MNRVIQVVCVLIFSPAFITGWLAYMIWVMTVYGWNAADKFFTGE